MFQWRSSCTTRRTETAKGARPLCINPPHPPANPHSRVGSCPLRHTPPPAGAGASRAVRRMSVSRRLEPRRRGLTPNPLTFRPPPPTPSGWVTPCSCRSHLCVPCQLRPSLSPTRRRQRQRQLRRCRFHRRRRRFPRRYFVSVLYAWIHSTLLYKCAGRRRGALAGFEGGRRR